MITSTTKSDLKKVKDILIMPSAWVQGVMRTDRFGHSVMSDENNVACRCLMAAMFDAVGGRGTVERRERYDAMEAAIEPHFKQCSIAMFNDDPKTTHADILNVIDKAMQS